TPSAVRFDLRAHNSVAAGAVPSAGQRLGPGKQRIAAARARPGAAKPYFTAAICRNDAALYHHPRTGQLYGKLRTGCGRDRASALRSNYLAMLILSRKLNESIVIDGRIIVKVLRIDK